MVIAHVPGVSGREHGDRKWGGGGVDTSGVHARVVPILLLIVHGADYTGTGCGRNTTAVIGGDIADREQRARREESGHTVEVATSQ